MKRAASEDIGVRKRPSSALCTALRPMSAVAESAHSPHLYLARCRFPTAVHLLN